MVLCVITSKKYGILSKWTIRVRGRERVREKCTGWSVGRRMYSWFVMKLI